MPDDVDEYLTDFKMRAMAGEFDEHLVDISQILQHRALMGEVAVKWRLQLGDLELTEDDLTFEEAHRWSKIAGENWSTLRPLADSGVCRALLIVLLSSRLGLEGDELQARLDSYKWSEVVGAFTETQEVSPSPLGQSAD